MSDDKDNAGAQDRARVSGEEGYEVRHLAERHGLSMDEARELIDKRGPSREAIEAAINNG